MKSRRAFVAAIGVGAAGALLGPHGARAQHGHGEAPAVVHPDGTVLVFAAATLKPALDEIVRAYQAAGAPAPTIAYGPTPVFAKNIVDGAPADIFFSADTMWMDYLAARKLIRLHTREDVVRNEVVLVQGGHGDGAPAAIDASFPIAKLVGSGPVAMCNPDSHPAGRFGKASLEHLGLWKEIADKVAIVENPQVAVAMVARGDVPAAVVFATDAHGIAGVRISGTLPDSSHAPILYPAAITMGAAHPDEAQRFLAYLVSPPAREIFDRFGYR
jgi:molybdate transport system substrate-binding protein